MNKSLAIVAAILAAATMLASSAQAGLKIRLGFGGPLPVFTAHGNGGHSARHYHRKRYIARRIVKKEKVYVAKRKTTSATKVAKQEKQEKVIAKVVTQKPAVVAAAPVVEPEVIADSENSSITTAALDAQEIAPVAAAEDGAPAPIEAVASEQKPAKAASKLDCKKFFPSVGMTLTVPCE